MKFRVINFAICSLISCIVFIHDVSAQRLFYSYNPDIVNSIPVLSQTGNWSSFEASPRGIEFSSDGSKMFIVGAGATVYQFGLLVPYNVKYLSSSVTYNLSGDDSTPHSIRFNAEGTKMYIAGDENDQVFQYSLSTPFDLSSGVTLDGFIGASSSPRAISFSPDGRRFWYVSDGLNRVFQHNLTIPYDLTTSSPSVSYDISSQESSPSGIAFSVDGTKMFIVGTESNELNQYSLSIPFDLSSGVTYDGSPFVLGGSPRDIAFSSDQTKVFIPNLGGDIAEYNFSTSEIFKEVSANNGGVEGSMRLSIIEDEFVNGGNTLQVGTHYTIDNLPSGLTPSILVSSDGSYATLTLSGNAVSHNIENSIGSLEFTFTDAAFVASDAVDVANSMAASSGLGIGFIYDLNPSLTYSAPIDISLAELNDSFLVQELGATPEDVQFSSDGLKMYLSGAFSNNIVQYSLATPYDISSGVTYDGAGVFPVGGSRGIYLTPEGTRLFTVSNVFGVQQFNLSTPYDITAGKTLIGNVTNLPGMDLVTEGITFSPNGSKMFLIGSNSDFVREYSLEHPFDITSAITSITAFSVASQESIPKGLFFNANGTKLFVTGNSSDAIHAYNLSSSYSLGSGVTFEQTLDVSAEENVVTGIVLSNDNTSIYVTGNSQRVHQYSIDKNVFKENSSDDGSVFGSMSVNLTGDSFINSGGQLTEGVDYTVDNLPSGLQPNISISADGHSAALSLGGSATNNGILNSIIDLQFSFADNAFISSQALDVENATSASSGLGIEFIEVTPVLLYYNDIDIVVDPPVHQATPFDVSSEETSPNSITFSHDGTKAYIIGAQTFRGIHQYSLSIPYDITSGVTYDGASENFGSPYAHDIEFNEDGTKMFMLRQGGTVYEYALTTPYVVTSGVNAIGTPLDVLSETGAFVSGIDFSPDGSKMFITGTDDDEVNQFSLSLAYDLSVGVIYDGAFSVAGQEASPQEVELSIDGLKMFILGYDGDDINQYSLTTPFDVTSGVSFDGSFSIASEETFPTGFAIAPKGTIFVTGGISDEINQYNVKAFYEPPINDGSVEGQIGIIITNDSFTNAGGTLSSGVDYTINNLPSGLSPNLAVASDGKSAILTLNGTTSATNEVELEFTFQNSAFVGNDASSVINAINANSGMPIEFFGSGGARITQEVILSEQNDLKSDIIYPNPSSNLITVRINISGTQNVGWSILDLAGREVKKGSLRSNESEIEVSDLHSGNYLLIIGKLKFHQKLQVKH